MRTPSLLFRSIVMSSQMPLDGDNSNTPIRVDLQIFLIESCIETADYTHHLQAPVFKLLLEMINVTPNEVNEPSLDLSFLTRRYGALTIYVHNNIIALTNSVQVQVLVCLATGP
jgi:hypothetical protein